MAIPLNSSQSTNQNLSQSFTKVPNVFFDFWQKYLNPSEFSVLLCLVRMSHGWQKSSCEFSYSEISKACNISLRLAKKIIASLESRMIIKKVVTKIHSHSCEKNTYTVNTETPDTIVHNSRKSAQKEGEASAKSAPPPGAKSARYDKESKKKKLKETKKESYEQSDPPPDPKPQKSFSSSFQKEGKELQEIFEASGFMISLKAANTWRRKFGISRVYQCLNLMIASNEPIRNCERWMEAALKNGFDQQVVWAEQNKAFALEFSRTNRNFTLKMNKSYLEIMGTGKDYPLKSNPKEFKNFLIFETQKIRQRNSYR